MMVLVAIGGFFGAILRFMIALHINKRLVGTWIVNITGSVLLAYLFHLHQQENISDGIWAIAGIGFCGAFTTFSTFGNETIMLIQENKYKQAVRYVVSSLVISIGSAAIVLHLLTSTN
ncbi:fluoride efflux transporter CrcB [Oceanobacillus manasiensis]|uniref:fluoride efflux transporter CrcB n=1 Tax=Oceanobacillus manasiensis TaxID=586413 RepID=UPI0005A8BC92|nr:fluoride efflux transporter CrcB [Oceanobacillus manasiensis]